MRCAFERLGLSRLLALLALALGVLGLAEPRAAAGPGIDVSVVVAVRDLRPGAPILPSQVRVETIRMTRVPSGVLHNAADALYRSPLAAVPSGALVVAYDLVNGVPRLAAGDRAVPLRVMRSSAPPLAQLGRGAVIDLIVSDARGARVLAERLELLAPAVARDDGVALTVRAPVAVALELAGAESRGAELRILLRQGRGA